MAERIDRPQSATHVAVPGEHITVLQVSVLVVNLIEELPGQDIRESPPARHDVAQPLFIQLLRLVAGKELVLYLARTTVRRIVGVAGPKVVPTPVVGLHLKDAVIRSEEHKS